LTKRTFLDIEKPGWDSPEKVGLCAKRGGALPQETFFVRSRT
jgi:hypothetical protein